jgi:hypothetical protein
MQNDKPKKKTRNGYRLMIYIDHKLKTAIQELATENSRPMVKEINRALKFWLEKHHGKPGPT